MIFTDFYPAQRFNFHIGTTPGRRRAGDDGGASSSSKRARDPGRVAYRNELGVSYADAAGLEARPMFVRPFFLTFA